MTPAPASRTLNNREFEQLSAWIERHLGVKMPPVKRQMLEARLHKRLRQLGMSDFRDYVDYLFSRPANDDTELPQFVDLVTTHKTEFLREKRHFELLRDQLLPAWQWEVGETFRVWSAACSSGEEVYTIGMLLSDYQRHGEHFQFEVYGSDVSTGVLEIARRGIYSTEHVRHLPMDWRRSYLMRSRDGQPRVRVVPELRSRTHYFPLNLMHPPYPVPWKFQMIFLRNVLIYFSRANQQRVLQACCDCLASGGYLIVGHSETTHGMSLPVKSIAQSVYQRI